MTKSKIIAICTGAIALTAVQAHADFTSNPNKDADVQSVSIHYKLDPSTTCPRKVTIRAIAKTEGLGKVDFIFRKAGGGASGVLSAQAERRSDGRYHAMYTQEFFVSKSTKTKYMAEAGPGKISPWIWVDTPCTVKPKDKTADADKPDGGGKPTGPGKPSGNNNPKPLPPQPEPANHAKPICKGKLSIKRVAATVALGRDLTISMWEILAESEYGSKFDKWSKAKDRKTSCKGIPGAYWCTVSARPCSG